MPKYAIILTTTKDSITFRSSNGFYNKEIHNLKQANYEVINISVDSLDSLKLLQELPESSVEFLWFRMHGSPQSMTASNTLSININNISEIFNYLPIIMHYKSIIYLDSCSTGSFEYSFSNVQFEFAKLTLKKPDIQIVAPSKDCHIQYFSISPDGLFHFEMLASHYSTENISVILGKETKTLLNHAISENIKLESIKDELIKSLQVDTTCPFIENYKTKFQYIFDLSSQLIETINRNNNSETTLKQVKELIEDYHASPNFPENFILFSPSWKTASPLFCAIYNKFTDVVIYLIDHGADLFFSINGISCLDYAKLRDNQIDTKNFNDIIIKTRRDEERDSSKIYDSIINYLRSKKKQDANAQNLLKFSFPPLAKEKNDGNEEIETNKIIYKFAKN